MSEQISTKGTVKQIGEMQTFDSGFYKCEVIVTIDEDSNYPQPIKFELLKETAAKALEELKVGQKIEMFYNLRGNEYNGKFYVSVQGWRWDIQGEATAKPSTNKPAANDDDLPF
jgi:hypothetical protein